jgi:hypothetical protein
MAGRAHRDTGRGGCMRQRHAVLQVRSQDRETSLCLVALLLSELAQRNHSSRASQAASASPAADGLAGGARWR